MEFEIKETPEAVEKKRTFIIKQSYLYMRYFNLVLGSLGALMLLFYFLSDYTFHSVIETRFVYNYNLHLGLSLGTGFILSALYGEWRILKLKRKLNAAPMLRVTYQLDATGITLKNEVSTASTTWNNIDSIRTFNEFMVIKTKDLRGIVIVLLKAELTDEQISWLNQRLN